MVAAAVSFWLGTKNVRHFVLQQRRETDWHGDGGTEGRRDGGTDRWWTRDEDVKTMISSINPNQNILKNQKNYKQKSEAAEWIQFNLNSLKVWTHCVWPLTSLSVDIHTETVHSGASRHLRKSERSQFTSRNRLGPLTWRTAVHHFLFSLCRCDRI